MPAARLTLCSWALVALALLACLPAAPSNAEPLRGRRAAAKKRDMLEEAIQDRDEQQGAARDAAHSKSANRVRLSFPPPPPRQCVHGYLSASDRSTCVCNTGWTGPHCAHDALPSCARGPGQPCFGDLRYNETARSVSCACLAECVEYVGEEVLSVFGEGGFEPSVALPLAVHPDLILQCADDNGARSGASSSMRLLVSGQIRPATEREQRQDEIRVVHTDYGDCYADCSGAPGHVCNAHFCECPDSRAGAYCQSKVKRPVRMGTDDSRLTFQILEVPGALLLERTRSSLYGKRTDFWAADYFLEQLLRDPAVLVDDNASVIYLPSMLDPGTNASTWLRGMQRMGTIGTGIGPDRPTLARAPVNEQWVAPRAMDPPLSFYMQNTGLPDEIGARSDIAMPLHDYKFMLDIRSFRTLGAHANMAALATLPALREERRAFYEPSAKTLEFYFVGRTKLDQLSNTTDPAPHCLDERLFTADPEACPCLLAYSECMRQFIVHNYRTAPGMFLVDPKLEEAPPVELDKDTHVRGPGHKSSEWALSPRQHSAVFCLVAGGYDFDMRIVSAIMSGCIPFWTMLEQIPALPRVLRHERFLVRLTPATRPAIAHLETFLQCYSPAVRAKMIGNLEMTWPAFTWANGTAYEHVLLEIAELTNKTVPSAMKTILREHGAQYVAEMLKVDLHPYASLPGMSQAIQLREELEVYDQFSEDLDQVAECVSAIPGVGDPAAIAAAATFSTKQLRTYSTAAEYRSQE